MDHETAYLLMMDALDGELTGEGHDSLVVHLQACPNCMREWQALQTIDTLLRQAPILSPAADFAQQTLIRLPNRRLRRFFLMGVYVLFVLSGILPWLLGMWLYNILQTSSSGSIILENFGQAAFKLLQLTSVLFDALLDALGQFIIEEPTVIGLLLIMAGIISVWQGVYQQLVMPPRTFQ